MNEMPDKSTPEAEVPRPFQFSVRALMIWIALVAVYFALATQAPMNIANFYLGLLLIGTSIWMRKIPEISVILFVIGFLVTSGSLGSLMRPLR